MSICSISAQQPHLGALTSQTGGQIYYYSGYTPALHQEQLYRELYRNLSRDCAYDSLLRLRTSTGTVSASIALINSRCSGLSVTQQRGHFTLINQTDLQAPMVHADSLLQFEFDFDDKFKEDRAKSFFYSC